MKLLLTTVMAGGLLLGVPLAANAQYIEPATPADPMIEQPLIEAPLSEAVPAEPGLMLPGEQVRIVLVDPAAADAQIKATAQSGALNQIQAEVSADPVLADSLAAANINAGAVFDLTRQGGLTTIYASG